MMTNDEDNEPSQDDERQSEQKGNQRQGGFAPIGAVLPGLFQNMEKTGFMAIEDDEAAQDSRQSRAGQKPAKSKARAKNTAKLAKAAADIIERPDKIDVAYLARELVQCTLPHRDPGDVAVWIRRNGDYALGLQPGSDLKTGKSLGLPYGPLPRLLLLWIVTEAVRTKSRHIKLGSTLNEFLREIGLDPNTGRGKRGDATRLKKQLTRLLNCRISFQYSEGNALKGTEARLNMEVANKVQYWWDFRNPEQGALFKSEIVLGELFFEAITTRPVPLDMRALIPLRKSPLAIDVYTWATYRVFKLQQSGQKQVEIPLASLREQFGSEYSRLDNFKAAFAEALEKVGEVFPALDYTLEKNTLILRDGKGRAIPSRAERPGLPQRRAQQFAKQMARQISPKARRWFADNYPEWDIETALADFDNWREKQSIESANNDAHFKSFIKKWTK